MTKMSRREYTVHTDVRVSVSDPEALMPNLAIPGLEQLFAADVRLGTLEDHGVTRAGHRRVIPIVGGTVTGAIEARVLPGGADWQIVHADGTIEIDTRYSLETIGGALIHLRTRGVRSGAPGVLESLLAGADVAPSEYYFRLVVEVESAAPEHSDLQRIVIVASAARTADRVFYQAYKLT
jgi:hypothetical protein